MSRRDPAYIARLESQNADLRASRDKRKAAEHRTRTEHRIEVNALRERLSVYEDIGITITRGEPERVYKVAARVLSAMGGPDRACANELHRDVMSQDPCEQCAYYRAVRLIYAYAVEMSQRATKEISTEMALRELHHFEAEQISATPLTDEEVLSLAIARGLLHEISGECDVETRSHGHNCTCFGPVTRSEVYTTGMLPKGWKKRRGESNTWPPASTSESER